MKNLLIFDEDENFKACSLAGCYNHTRMFKLFGSLFDSNEKQLKKNWPVVYSVNDLEGSVQKLNDEDLAKKTAELRGKLGVNLETARLLRDPFLPTLTKQEIDHTKLEDRRKLESVMPEAFACAREAATRAVVHHAFDVQVLGAVFLSRGFVTELFTGEGKSLVATFALYLYALMGKGAHLVTVNDYLARRDGEWAGHIFNALSMKVGVITPGASYRFISDDEVRELKGAEGAEALKEREKVIKESGRLLMSSMKGTNLIQCSKMEAYACDVIYATNNEIGFDYLRDNMAMSLGDRAQSLLYFAIVDECDSILIDEARTPLIISSQAEDANELYRRFAQVTAGLKPVDDYVVDEKAGSVSLTDAGVDRVEKILNVENMWENYAFAHHLDNALKAKELYKRDDNYLIQDGEIRIVDEFTGRVLPGRRFSEGLHQAIEAKENVEIKRESRTLATITFQNLFRLYSFLAGMTGTALTESEEFAKIYNLEVIVVPTNKPVVRKDSSDIVFRTKAGKFRAVVQEIKGLYATGRPVLVGTASVDNSEYLSELLKNEGISHEVLNAKQHQKEALIVAKAGQKGMVTISTNMAGRGTDIALGQGVVALGGLHVLGTERHESRRIDNQLRGRSGRQGDPGSSRFYTSFEDDLMRIFGGDTMSSLLSRVGMDDDMPIEAAMIGKSIESAQKRVESQNFDIRKHLVEYDDVLNQQREIVYDLRRKILTVVSSQKQEETNEVQKPRNPGDVSFDWNLISDERVDGIADLARQVSLKDSATWQWAIWPNQDVLKKPLRLWILRLGVQYIDFVVDAQTKDDQKIDKKEEMKVLAGILDVVPLELAKICVDKMGFGSWTSFEKEFEKNEDVEFRRRLLYRLLFAAYVVHILVLGDEVIGNVERILILQSIDNLWVEHLDLMTDLRHGIELRGYAQRDPLVEYKNEGFSMFERMLHQMEDNIIRRFFKVRLVEKSPLVDFERSAAVHEELSRPRSSNSSPARLPSGGMAGLPRNIPSVDHRPGEVSKQKTVVNGIKIGRNDPCPCGSGKKYKKCCYPKYG